MEKITSRNNEGIKEFAKLTESKRYRSEKNMFTIESLKLVLEAVDANVDIKKVFVTQTCFDKNYDALQKLFGKCKNVSLIEDHVASKLAVTNGSQGIFAMCTKFNTMDKLPQKGKFVMLCGLQDSGNVGTIIRTAAALSLDGVIISDGTCDFYSQKVIRASMGALFKLPVYSITDDTVTISSLNCSFTTYCAVLSQNSISLCDMKFDENSIVVIGNEGNGLPQHVIEACAKKVIIPMSDNAESLNAAIAAGILIWEMSK